MKRSNAPMLLAAAALMALAACNEKGSTVQEMLGVEKNGPDAFNVVTRPPLSVPPEFALPTPAVLGTPNPNEPSASAAAQSILTGREAGEIQATLGSVNSAVHNASTNRLDSGAEQRLMQKLGVQAADPSIRETLAQEAANPDAGKSWSEKLLPQFKKDEGVLDAADEAKKLNNGQLKNAVKAPPAVLKSGDAK